MNNQQDRETPKKAVHLAELLPTIRQILDSGGKFRLTVTGTSMYPTILGGRDEVTLERPTRPLRRYDLPLYRRKSGQFVLHRIVRVEKDGTFTCCGDHQWDPEPGIRPEQVIALTTELCRKGKRFSADKPGYLRWVKLWVWLLPFRRLLFRIAGLLSRLTNPFRRRNR